MRRAPTSRQRLAQEVSKALFLQGHSRVDRRKLLEDLAHHPPAWANPRRPEGHRWIVSSHLQHCATALPRESESLWRDRRTSEPATIRSAE